MHVNDPAVVAEVTTCFVAYEDALVAGDVGTLNLFFWSSPHTLRFGIADAQHGADELAAWRAAQPPLQPGRALEDTIVTTFGTDHAVVTTCFRYPDAPFLGRQTQTWARLDGAWRIVNAHVSEIPSADATT